MNKAEKKLLYIETSRQAIDLYRRSEGVLLVFILMCYLVKHFIVFPLMNQIWALTLSTMPIQFITNQNAFMLLQYPYVPLVGLVLVLLFSYIIAWEISGIMLCLEYNRQGKAVNLFKLLLYTFKHMKHVLRPRNWLFFFFLIVILPFTDLYSAAGMTSTFSVPEYISDFLYATPLTAFLFVILQLGILILAVRCFYLIPGVLLYKKDFSVGIKESGKLIKKRSFMQILQMAFYSLKRSISIYLLPVIIFVIAFIVMTIGLMQINCDTPAALLFTLKNVVLGLSVVFNTFLRIAVTSYLVINYTLFSNALGIDTSLALPDHVMKEKKVRTFKYVRPVLTFAMICFSVLFYGLISLTFTYFPKESKEIIGDTAIIAHKGYTAKAPENTIDAFDLACKANVDMIELDIRESKDGIPIVIHNDNLLTAAGVNESVYDLTFEELKKIPITYSFTKEQFPNSRIPSLEEVLERYGNKMPLLIEIKMDDRTPELPKKIVDLMNKYHCKENCMIHSGSYEALTKVKKIDDTIPCGLIIALGTGSYESLPDTDFFSVEHTFVDYSMLLKIHNLNKKVYAWTVNDNDSIASMSSLDVDGVITDDPNAVIDQGFSYKVMIKESLEHLSLDMPDEEDQHSSDYENGNY